MKLIAQVKLQPTPEQYQTLLETLERINAACNYISEISWNERIFGKYRLQKRIYFDVKVRFSLTAQVIVRAISKVSASYKGKGKRISQHIFDPRGGVAFDSRILTWHIDKHIVSIWTLAGRQRIPFLAGPRQLELLQSKRGESDLILIKGQFYLFCSVEVETPSPQDVDDFLGIDLGVKNIATDSDGEIFSGAKVNGLRHRHSRLRAKLQSKGTKAAKRLLKKRSRKESRFAKDTNHCISKRIVEKAQCTGRGIAMEDLTGIRDRIKVRKAQRRQHSSWSFYDLRAKIEYKAKRDGVFVMAVDPRNTSRICPACGCIDKRNRPNQSTFLCVSCGFAGHADRIAAGNIARRAVVNLPYISATSNG